MEHMTNRHKMEIILKERRKGKTREQCAIAAHVPLHRIVHWYNEGKQRTNADNIYFYKSLKRIEDSLNEQKKYKSDIETFILAINVHKRINFLNFIKQGKTRQNALIQAEIKPKLLTKWETLGRKGIEPFKTFHENYKNAREIATQNEQKLKDDLKKETIIQIKKGKTLKQAAKLVQNGKHEKTIINFYNMGKSGNKNHVQFYNDCEKYLKPPVNTNIFAPLPQEWKDHFEKLPMNKTGIAWVSRNGNNWTYARQENGKIKSFSDPNIRKLHKKVIGAGEIWGIRDMNLAKQTINNDHLPTKKPKSKNKVTVVYDRLNKNEFTATVKGTINNNQYQIILRKLKFFTYDIEETKTRKVNGKTEIFILYRLNISMLNSFKEKSKELGWENVIN